MPNEVNQNQLTCKASTTGIVVPMAPGVVVYGEDNLVLGYATQWRITIVNTGGGGAGNITAIRTKRRTTHDSAYSPWADVTSGLPVAPNGSISLRDSDDCSYDIVVELTGGAAATTASISLVGT